MWPKEKNNFTAGITYKGTDRYGSISIFLTDKTIAFQFAEKNLKAISEWRISSFGSILSL